MKDGRKEAPKSQEGNGVAGVLNGSTAVSLDRDSDAPLSLAAFPHPEPNKLRARPTPFRKSMKLLTLPAALLLLVTSLFGATADTKKIVFIAGAASHGAGEHEHRAGCLLFQKCLANVPGVEVKVFTENWPTKQENGKTVDDNAALEDADAIILYSDGGPSHPLLQGERLALIDRLVKRGVGLALIHYAVEPTKEKGQKEFIDWIGGAFEVDWSVNPAWAPEFKSLPDHPVTRGVRNFMSRDEWYFHLRFRDGMRGVTPLLSAVPPASTMQRADGPHEGNPAVRAAVARGDLQHVVWASEQEGRGRGFGFSGGHFHANWANDDQRKLVLNAALWLAGVEVPANGVESHVTDEDMKANLDDKPDFAAEPPPTIVPPDMFRVPEGLEVTVWARTPMLRNPTNMDIDAEGRIWIAEGVNYRRHQGREPKGDRIVVIADLNKNGRADKAWTFVQEPDLIAPLGVSVIDNQVIVANAPDLIVYTDVNRDGKFDPRVDQREVLLTGFNGRNHDHSLHSVTFGPDGLWYFNQGNSGAYFTDRSGKTFRVGSPYDPLESGATPLYGWKPQDIAGAKSDDGHVYTGGFAMRMQPDGTNVEIIGHGFRNSYEQTVTSFGDVFQNDNDDPPACRTTWLMEYGFTGFFSKDGQRNWNADRRPGQSTPVAEWRQEDPGVIPAGDVYGGGAPTGIVFVEGDELGKEWRGLLISAEAARNTLYGYFPKADGAGYALERFAFMTTNVEEEFAGVDFKGGHRSITRELKTLFRPADVAVGPDGAIYVADWFDPRVGGHQDLDDEVRGTIYRIAPKGFKGVAPKLDLTTTEGQIAALKNPAVNVRALGFMKLKEQGATAVPAVAKLLEDENPYYRARAVWLLAQLGGEGVAKVEAQLKAEDPMMRIAAFRALRRVEHRVLEHARTLANDASPAVRREAALAMRDVSFSDSKDVLLAVARGYDGKDRAYLEAWGTGCTGKEVEVYAALAAEMGEVEPLKWSAARAGLAWRLTPAAAVGDFATRAKAKGLSEADRLAAVTAIAFVPTREAALALVDIAEQADGRVRQHATWWLMNYKDSRWKEHGLADELKRRKLYDPESIEISAITVPEPDRGAEAATSVEAVLSLKGDATRGATLAQACLLCHRIGDAGAEYGPTLSGFAQRQPTEVVVRAILQPSADIALGYAGSEIELKSGEKVHGLVHSAGDPLIVQSTGGFTQMIPQDRVKQRRMMGRSLMLNAQQLGLGNQDVADIVAYLKTH